MTQNPIPLNYDASASFGITRTRQAAWIILFINGILGTLGGAFIAIGLSIVGYMVSTVATPGRGGPGAAPGSAPPNAATLLLVGMAIIFGLIPFTCGITSIVCSFKIRKGSRAATLTAIILTGLQLLIILAILGMSLISALLQSSGDMLGLLVGAALYGAAAALEAILLWLLIRTLRELSARPTLAGSPRP